MKILFLFTLAAIIGLINYADAAIYTWTDEDGTVRFSDSPVHLKDKGPVGVMREIENTQEWGNETDNTQIDNKDKPNKITPTPKDSKGRGPRIIDQQKSRKEIQIEKEVQRVKDDEQEKKRQEEERYRKRQIEELKRTIQRNF